MQAITDYKSGMIYAEFADAVELFVSVDRSVRDYLNKAVIRYAQDHAARQPNSESERWLLLPYRTRVAEMKAALEVVGGGLGIKGGLLRLDGATQPVELHCVPDSFSIPESKKFAAYIFDDEASAGSGGRRSAAYRGRRLGALPTIRSGGISGTSKPLKCTERHGDSTRPFPLRACNVCTCRGA